MLLRFLATAIEVVERGNGRGREASCSRARESPRVGPDPRRGKVPMMGKSKVNAFDVE
jgi:hypothetical protein